MIYTVTDLKSSLKSLHDAGDAALRALDAEFADINSWLDDIEDAVKRGDLNNVRQFPKAPVKKHGVLGTINESLNNTSQGDSCPDPETVKKKPRKESKRFQAKKRQSLASDEETENENDSSKRRRGTITNEIAPAVVQISDTTAEESNYTNSELNGTKRLTRTRTQRTTIVKESRETFVIEKAPSQPPVVRSPSPIDLCSPEPVSQFKAPPPAKICTIPVPDIEVTLPAEEVPVAPPTRMTRTKTRAMAKEKKEPPKSSPPEKSTDHESEQEGEYAALPAQSRLAVPSCSKQKFGTPVGKTPLSHSLLLGTPVSGNSSNIIVGMHSFITKPAPASVKKDRQEDFLQKITQKTNEASKKREELIKAQTEEKIKKRQEKMLKVNAAREAMEKERAEKLRQQMALEEEKRRKMAQQAAEAAKAARRQQEEEQRRLAEEKKREEERRAAEEKKREQELLRQAEERKKEEEKRRLAEERRKLLEEKKKKLMEERRIEKMEAELRKKEAEKAAAAKFKEALAAAKAQPLNETFVKPLDATFDVASASYDMTPMPGDRPPAPSESVEDYGIEDAGCDDSSDDESHPKKEIPAWAQGKNRMPHLKSQFLIRHRQAALFFGSQKTTPDLSKMFAKIDRKMLIRKSSAVWRTPPVKFLNETVF